MYDVYSVSTKALPDPDLETGGEEKVDAENNCEVADFLTESAFFEAVGVGVGQTETYLIVLTLKQLGAKPGILKARFFGKFFGTNGYCL